MPDLALNVATAVRRYRSRLEAEFPGRLRKLFVYGSTARGEATEDSDVDVLALMDHLTDAERARAIDLGTYSGFDFDLIFDTVVLTESEWSDMKRRERLFPQEVEREGVPM